MATGEHRAEYPLKKVVLPVVKALTLAGAYFLAGWLGLCFALTQPAITLIWLPTGIATAGLFRWGIRYWPAILGITTLLQEFSFNLDWPIAGGVIAGQTLAPVAAAWMLKRADFNGDFARVRDIWVFAGYSGVGMLISALLGVGTLAYAGRITEIPVETAWLHWWLGDWMGVLVAGPILVSLSATNWAKLKERGSEVITYFVSLATLSLLIFFRSPTEGTLPLIFIPFFFTIWAALRFGAMGTALGVLTLATFAASGTAMGLGPFAVGETDVFLLWAYLITSTVFNLMITGIEIGRREARLALEESKQRLLEANEELALAVEKARALAIEAEAANRTKSAFLSNMSHELRTPLSGIIGMTELLLNSPLSADQQQYAKIASSCGESLLRLINDLLDFSVMGAGKFTLAKRPFLLNEVLESTLDILQSTMKEEVVVSHEILPNTPQSLVGDPDRLKQILINLAHNGIKFTERGTVKIRIRLLEDLGEEVYLHFSVEDSGVGVSPEWNDRLFKPFVQVDDSSRRKFGGAGLGLAICKQLVDLMDGEIGLTSEEGKGSLFWFTAKLGKGLRIAPSPK